MAEYAPILWEHIWAIGADSVLQFSITDEDGETPVSMQGATLQFVLRAEGPEGAVVLTKTAAGGGITLSDSDPTDGVTNDQVNVNLVRADTIDQQGVILIQPGVYEYVLEKIDLGDRKPLAFGPAILRLLASR